jgi:hypothetical protein
MTVSAPAMILLPCLFLAAACGQESGGTGSPGDETATAQVGVADAGGPAPRPRAVPLLRPGTVELRRDGGGSYTVTVLDGRRTTVGVAPGQYKATASSGDARCQPVRVGVLAGGSVVITATCDVK